MRAVMMGRKEISMARRKAPHIPDSTFDPQLIARYQRRFPGFDGRLRRYTRAA